MGDFDVSRETYHLLGYFIYRFVYFVKLCFNIFFLYVVYNYVYTVHIYRNIGEKYAEKFLKGCLWGSISHSE